MDFFKDSSDVRRNETICYLIGFGIGVGCCIVYRLLSNFLTSATNTNRNPSLRSTCDTKQSLLLSTSTNNSYVNQTKLINTKLDDDDNIPNNTLIDEMTWSEMSSSLSTLNLFQDSYHSNSLTGDSGVDCPEIPIKKHEDDNDGILLRKYESDTGFHHDTQTVTESHVMSYISTEKGLERALEQTSRFYTDLEHIATDLGTLTKRYSNSHRSIDALDWDWIDDVQSPVSQSPKYNQRKQIIRSNNKNKIRRRINTNINQTEYNESDNENRSFEYSTSPLRKKHSSVYFDSTDNTTDEDHVGDETLQINS